MWVTIALRWARMAVRCVWVYLGLLALVLSGAALFLTLLVRERRARQRDAADRGYRAGGPRLVL